MATTSIPTTIHGSDATELATDDTQLRRRLNAFANVAYVADRQMCGTTTEFDPVPDPEKRPSTTTPSLPSKDSASIGTARKIRILKQWVGEVTEVHHQSFFALLYDQSDSSSPRELVELPFEEISGGDTGIVEPGSIFYWSIGYEMFKGASVRRVSEVRFRRTPIWSKCTLQAIEDRANEVLKVFLNDGAGR